MTSRKPAKNTKPIIFYDGLFHYVEENVNEIDDVQYALFKVYNLNRSFGELRKEVISAIGNDETTVTLIDDFAKPDSSSESSMDESFIAVNATVKIKILFKQKHRDAIEHLRSSQAIKDLTQNGFADWVPLDDKSYTNIERNAKVDRDGQSNATKLRSFDEDIDSKLLEMIINEIYQDQIELALEKLFPGPIVKINREVNDIVMRVVSFEVHHSFDEEIGKLFIEVLNALIEERKLDSKSEEVSNAFATLVYRLFAVIRNLIYLDEFYGEFKLPSWVPFFSQPTVKEIRDKISLTRASEEDALLDIVEFTSLDEPLDELRPLVRRLNDEVGNAQRKVNDAVERWKSPKRASNVLFYSSMTSITVIPTAFYYNNRIAGSGSGSDRLKVSVGVLLLSILLGIWSKKSHHDFHKAINFVKRIDPLLSSSKNNVELLDQWLERISVDGKYKIKVDNYEYKERKVILRQLFHKFALANANIRNSFNVTS